MANFGRFFTFLGKPPIRGAMGIAMSVAAGLRVMRELNRRAERRSAGELGVVLAVDFLAGGSPGHARLFDRRGAMLRTVERREDEGLTAFRERARREAGSVAGAIRVVVGGLGPSATSSS
jgi:hypothetical protein